METTNYFPVHRPAPVRNFARLGGPAVAVTDLAAPETPRAQPSGLPMGLRGMQLTGRGRTVVAALALMIAMPVIGVGGQAFAESPSRPLTVESVRVEAGDTLWSFARQIALPGEDLRDVVAQIQLINGFDGADLFEGQKILLPTS